MRAPSAPGGLCTGPVCPLARKAGTGLRLACLAGLQEPGGRGRGPGSWCAAGLGASGVQGGGVCVRAPWFSPEILDLRSVERDS